MRRRRIGSILGIVALIQLMVIAVSIMGTSRAAVADDPADSSGLSVRIDTLSPDTIDKGATITMTGVVQNTRDADWTNAYAYLVISRSPFTTRRQVENAVANGDSYTGERIVAAGTFDEIGNVPSGSSRPFSLSVPYDKLRLSGAQGVYPVGVQILATDVDGSRTSDAVARATTFLPRLNAKVPAAPTGLVWTFGMPAPTTSSADDTRRLVATISRGGIMRRQLALAQATPREARTILIDPALLDAVADLADRGKRTEVHTATVFGDELLALVRDSSTWVMDYGRPDSLALTQHATKATALRTAVNAATAAAVTHHHLLGSRVSYPTSGAFTSDVLAANRQPDVPFIVSESSLPDWQQRLGSTVMLSGESPLIVDASLPDVAGSDTTATIRQSVLANTALAAMSRAADPTSHADGLTFINPGWNPSSNAFAADLIAAVSNQTFSSPATGDQLLNSSPPTYGGAIASKPTAHPLSGAQIDAAANLARGNATFSDLTLATADQRRELNSEVAASIGSRWRSQPARALTTTRAAVRQLDHDVLKAVAITGPPTVTLSGRTGTFPLTIANPTSDVIHVAVRFTSSNPSVQLRDIALMSIDPRERRTVDAKIDVGNQSSTTVSAQLITRGGVSVAKPAEFNVRSSQVGLFVWIFLGAAGVLIIIAFGRRFLPRFRRAGGDDE